MVSVIERLFGPGKKEPSSSEITRKIADTDRERIAIEAQREKAVNDRAEALESLDEAGMKVADDRLADLSRRAEINAATSARLRDLLDATTKAEAKAALAARKAAVEKAVRTTGKLLDQYEAAALAVLEYARAYTDICAEVDEVNAALAKVGSRESVDGPEKIHRKDPDIVTPARVEKRQVNLQEHYGPGALPRFETVEVEIEESVRRGRYQPSLLGALSLPAARAGLKAFIHRGGD